MIEKIKKFWLDYETHILIGIIIVLISTILFPTCKKKVEQIVLAPTYQKIDSLNYMIEESKLKQDSLQELLNLKNENTKVIASKIKPVDNSKLKKDEDIIRKNINSDSLSIDGIISYWTVQFKRPS